MGKKHESDVAVLSLKEVAADIAVLFHKRGLKRNPFTAKAIVDAVESHWAMMEDERSHGFALPSWSSSVADFDEPPSFLVFDIGAASVTVCVGAADLTAFEARQVADETCDGPMSKMVTRIETSPKGWSETLHVKRSEFELEPISQPKPTFT